MRFLLITALAALVTDNAAAQLVPLETGTDAEFRAIHAPLPGVVWTGGRGGVYAVTTDAGATWRADSVAGAAGLFFTGAWAADAQNAWLLGTSFDGGLARIYRTADGGASWSVQWESTDEGVFMDALQCWTIDHCVAYGDPVVGRLVIVRTTDGATWSRVRASDMPSLLEGEAGFAASGTTLTLRSPSLGWIGTGGGASARVYMTRDGGATWSVSSTPLPGNSTSGIFGVTFSDSVNGVAVGGDYERRTDEQRNVIRTMDGGSTWEVVGASQPHGVRYGAVYSPLLFTPMTGIAASMRMLVAVGPSGSGMSMDDGATWTALDTTHYNTVTFDPEGTAWFAGPDGRVAYASRTALLRRPPPTGYEKSAAAARAVSGIEKR